MGGNAFFIGFFDNLVIYISEVLNICDLVTSVFKISSEYIKSTYRAGVSYVNIIINCWTTSINFTSPATCGTSSSFFLVMVLYICTATSLLFKFYFILTQNFRNEKSFCQFNVCLSFILPDKVFGGDPCFAWVAPENAGISAK